jgi:hypothetical protein
MDARSRKLFRGKSNAKNSKLNLNQKLAKKAEPFTLKERTMYKVEHDNIKQYA